MAAERPVPLVLDEFAEGRTTRGGIADYIGRASSDVSHPLTVLEDCGLVARNRMRSGVGVPITGSQSP